MPAPWNGWYHCTGNTYGTWLRGSDLGFRERHHRKHVEGDYRNPPPAGKYAHLKRQSIDLMTQPAVHLNDVERRIVLDAFVGSLKSDGVEVIAVAVDGHHFHVLLRCPERDPRQWVARAKGRSARRLIRDGRRTGKVWGIRCAVKPIMDRRHQVTTFWYILRHAEQGAAVWRVPKREEEAPESESGLDPSLGLDPDPDPAA